MSPTFERTVRWYVYAFKGDSLFTGYVYNMNDPHVTHLAMNGWEIFRREAKEQLYD